MDVHLLSHPHLSSAVLSSHLRDAGVGPAASEEFTLHFDVISTLHSCAPSKSHRDALHHYVLDRIGARWVGDAEAAYDEVEGVVLCHVQHCLRGDEVWVAKAEALFGGCEGAQDGARWRRMLVLTCSLTGVHTGEVAGWG